MRPVAQAGLALMIDLRQVMPRAKARAMPASNGFKAGPAKLKTPNRPPQPTNPIFDPDGCAAYISYTCEFSCDFLFYVPSMPASMHEGHVTVGTIYA